MVRGAKRPRYELMAEDCFDDIMEAADTKLASALFGYILAANSKKSITNIQFGGFDVISKSRQKSGYNFCVCEFKCR